MKITIVIPNYNGIDLLKDNINAVIEAANFAKNQGYPTNICVIDDCSSDASTEFIKKHFPFINLIVNEKNMGFAKTVNRAIKTINSDIAVILASDVKPTRKFLLPLIFPFEHDDSVFAVSAKSINETGTFSEGRKQPCFRGGFLRFSQKKNMEPRPADYSRTLYFHTFYAVGGQCAVNRTIFLKLGGFDELFYPFYWEDTDICFRAWALGYKILYKPESVVIHKNHGCIQKHFGKYKSYMLSITKGNRNIFAFKNFQSPLLTLHCVNLIIRVLISPFILDISFIKAFWRAIKLLPAILKQRKKFMKMRRYSDKHIISFAKSFTRY